MADTLPPVPFTRLLMQVVITFVVIALLLFVPAGTLDWPLGWWFLLLTFLAMAAAIAYVLRVNPEIVAARQKVREGTKGWDLVIVTLVIVGIIAIPPAAGFEIRFGGAPLPFPVVVLGYALFTLGFALMTWAQGENRHFEPSVRIQTDRDHQVVDSGPYALMRHPGYISGSMFALGMALALGSSWAVVPAALTVLILIVRTVLEDNTLKAEPAMPNMRAACATAGCPASGNDRAPRAGAARQRTRPDEPPRRWRC